MNSVLAKCIHKSCPAISKTVAEGTVKSLFNSAKDYLDNIFRDSIRKLNSKIDLQYVGCEEMTPEEYYEFCFKLNGTNQSFDIARSDVYAVYFVFRANGETIRKGMLMPFCNDGNIMTISGTKYVVSPVLSDSVISPKQSEVFVRLLSAKVNFFSTYRNLIENGISRRYPMVHTPIIKSGNVPGPLGEVDSSISLQLVCKYGFYGVFKRYIANPEKDIKRYKRQLTIGDGNDFFITDREITQEDRNKYNIFESIYKNKNELPPKVKNLRPDEPLFPHEVKILINKEIEITNFIRHFVGGLIYTIDAYRYLKIQLLANIREQEKENGNEDAHQEECKIWRYMFGQIIYKGNYTYAKIKEEVDTHMLFLDGCVDTLIIDKLKDVNVHVNNYYDLAQYIMSEFTTITKSAQTINSDLKNKYIDVMYYIFYEYILNFNKTIRKLNRKVVKAKLENSKESLTANEINEAFKEEFKYFVIFGLTRGGRNCGMNLNLRVADYTGDLKYPKCTVILEDQSRGEGVKQPIGKQRFPDVCETIKGQDTWLGSIFNLMKEVPSGRLKVNLYLQYDPDTGAIIIPEENGIAANILAIDSKLKLIEDNDSSKFDKVIVDDEIDNS